MVDPPAWHAYTRPYYFGSTMRINDPRSMLPAPEESFMLSLLSLLFYAVCNMVIALFPYPAPDEDFAHPARVACVLHAADHVLSLLLYPWVEISHCLVSSTNLVDVRSFQVALALSSCSPSVILGYDTTVCLCMSQGNGSQNVVYVVCVLDCCCGILMIP